MEERLNLGVTKFQVNIPVFKAYEVFAFGLYIYEIISVLSFMQFGHLTLRQNAGLIWKQRVIYRYFFFLFFSPMNWCFDLDLTVVEIIT